MDNGILKASAIRARHRRLPERWIAGALAAALVLGACGGDNKAKSAGQAVARVNGVEITVHQINNELMRLGVKGGADNQQAAKRVLDALIDQQLLVQQAAESKLDRDPQVMQALEQVRRRLLSEAYLERSLGVPRPGPEEVKKFYADNPALFEKHRVYSFRDFVIERPQFSDALRKRLDGAKAPADVVAVLKQMKIAYREAVSTRGAEQLPLDMLPKVAAMTKGDISILLNESSVVLMQLIDSTEQPVGLDQATPFIESYLMNTRKRQKAESRLKELRASAKIAYMGAFEGSAEAGQAPAPAAAPAAAVPAGTSNPSTPSTEAHDQSLRKGLQGLIGN
jgi:EpsD family peptidyl-prolyl cis-trans isomerase